MIRNIKINTMNKTYFFMTYICLMMSLLLFSCDNKSTPEEVFPDGQIVIVYDNDVHCAVDGYAKLVALRNQQERIADYVTIVSCGDFANGGVVGASSKGELIVDIMNEVGYDVVTLGNHEFDYGTEQMFNLTDKLNANVVSSNFKNCQTNDHVFPAYHIVNYGNVDVAYLGFTTTSTGTSVMFEDGNGNQLYTLMRNEFYQNAQNVIDEARAEGAEYVIALAHLGDLEQDGGHPNSVGLINNTNGIDAVIDGHEHSIIEERFVLNKDGKPVLLTSSGSYFQYVGMVSINTNGTVESMLVDLTSGTVPTDANTQQFVDNVKEEVNLAGQRVVGHSEVFLTVYDDEGNYVANKQEVNIGNLCADAYRSYTGADIAVINAGGIRAEINIGDVTFNDVLAMHPYSNEIVTAMITGQQLADALEFSVSSLPDGVSAFLQVSGMKFEVDASIPSPVVFDVENDIYSHVGNGERRVSNLQIIDPETGDYSPVDLGCTYTLASVNYLLVNWGDSGILRHAEPDGEYWTTDVEAITYYIDRLGGVIGLEYEGSDDRIVINR